MRRHRGGAGSRTPMRRERPSKAWLVQRSGGASIARRRSVHNRTAEQVSQCEVLPRVAPGGTVGRTAHARHTRAQTTAACGDC